jgi:hypothetical protein
MGLNELVTVDTITSDARTLKEIRKNITGGITTTTNAELNKVDGNKFVGDFNGLLNAANIPRFLWCETMALNGIKSSSYYDGSFVSIEIFDRGTINKLKPSVVP